VNSLNRSSLIHIRSSVHSLVTPHTQFNEIAQSRETYSA
jgi:hypothetical protein